MNVKHWAMLGAVVVAGVTALWRGWSARRRATVTELPAADRIRHAGRLVAGRGVHRVS